MRCALLRYTACLILGLMVSDAYGGAWTLEKGKQQYIVTYRSYATVAYFSGNGDRRDKLGRFNKQEVNVYSEYGVTNDLTAGVSLFVSRSSDVSRANAYTAFEESAPMSSKIELSGLRRTELFLRSQLYRDDAYVFSLQPVVSLPGYYVTHSEGSAIADAFEWGADAMGGLNFSLLGRMHFADLSAGYRVRGDGLGDQYRLHAGVGLSLDDDWTLLPELDTTISATGIHLATTTITGQNDYDLTKAQLSAVYKVNDRVRLQGGIFDHVAGRNTGAGGGGLLSVWISL